MYSILHQSQTTIITRTWISFYRKMIENIMNSLYDLKLWSPKQGFLLYFFYYYKRLWMEPNNVFLGYKKARTWNPLLLYKKYSKKLYKAMTELCLSIVAYGNRDYLSFINELKHRIFYLYNTLFMAQINFG